MDGETFGQTLRRLRRERGLSLRNLQALARYDFTYLGQVERGEKPGSLDLATTCDRSLGLNGQLVALYRRSNNPVSGPTDVEDNMRRREALKTIVVAPLSVTPLAAFSLPGTAEAASSAPNELIRSLESQAEFYRGLYHTAASPTDLLRMVCDHLNRSVELLRSGLPTSGRIRVLRNRSEIGTLAGRLAFFDLHDTVAARGYYGMAYEAASQASDNALAAAALGHLAFVPAGEGNPAAALDYLSGAVDHADRTDNPILLSWIHAIEAEFLATVDNAASLRALEDAESYLDVSYGDPVPPWFDYYSADRLEGFRGYTLLKTGNVAEARASLSTALKGLAPTAFKQRAVFLTDIASTYVTNGASDVEHACAVATEGVTSVAVTGYATARDRLRQFRTQLRPWDDTSVVRSLDERLAELTA